MLNTGTGKSTLRAIWEEVLAEKLNSPKVWLFLMSASAMFSYLIYKQGVVGLVLIVVFIVGLPVVLSIVAYPKFGIITLLVMAYVINLAGEFVDPDLPIGISMDLLEYLLIAGFFLKQKYAKNWDIFANPISYVIILWIIYNLMEVINPVAASMLAWVYTVRTVAIILLMYFVFVYQINEIKYVKLLIKIWLALSAFGAVWALKQEFMGFFNFEWASLRRDPAAMKLYYIEGHWRKFSLFSDPVTFAYNMVAAAVLCFAMLFGPLNKNKKKILVGLIFLYLWAMLYSGSRGAYVLVPACVLLLVVMYFNKTVMLISAGIGFMLAVLIFLPTTDKTLLRFQSAFFPSKDASYNVRAQNQAFIKPIIKQHPIGSGLGSVGVWSARFAPDSPLAKFPPDSGYVRVAVELGYIGLFLFCTLMFTVLCSGVNNFFLIRDPELRNYCLGMVLVIFALNIGNFPQQALVQFPSNILFYMAIALINVLKRLDDEKQTGAAIPVSYLETV